MSKTRSDCFKYKTFPNTRKCKKDATCQYTNRCNASNVSALLTEDYNFSKYLKLSTNIYLNEVKNEWIYASTPPYVSIACTGIAFPLGIT
jgi:hypothetical protein